MFRVFLLAGVAGSRLDSDALKHENLRRGEVSPAFVLAPKGIDLIPERVDSAARRQQCIIYLTRKIWRQFGRNRQAPSQKLVIVIIVRNDGDEIEADRLNEIDVGRCRVWPLVGVIPCRSRVTL